MTAQESEQVAWDGFSQSRSNTSSEAQISMTSGVTYTSGSQVTHLKAEVVTALTSEGCSEGPSPRV